MAFPPTDPVTPQDIEVLLELQHELDVANDSHSMQPHTWGTRATEADSRPAPKPHPRPAA